MSELSTSTSTAEIAIFSNAQPDTKSEPLTEAFGWGGPTAPTSEVVKFKVNGALWLRPPLVPFSERGILAVDAFAGAVNDSGTDEPAAMVMGDEGEELTPDGRPVKATETDPEKPFDPVTETVTGAVVVPTTVLTEPAESEMVKSGDGDGGVDAP